MIQNIKTMRVIILIALLRFCIGLDWSGYFSTDNRFLFKEDYPISFEEYRLSLNSPQNISENLKFYSEIWLRSFGLPNIRNLSDLSEEDKVNSFDLNIREAYIGIYGFSLKNLDIRIGRQRIAWGTADKINPTDNLNADDLEDIWDFGRHLGANGIKIDGYIKDFNLSYVFLPRFTPAVLPAGNWFYSNFSNITLPPGTAPESVYNSITMPAYNIKNSITGLKLKKNISRFDFSLSYVYGRDDIPILKQTTIVPAGIPGEVDIYNELVFPKMQIVGLDLAGSIDDFGLWAEGALFLPESINLVIDMSQLGMGVMDTLVLEKKPYVKYVFGADYTFKNGMYINLQYVHGFFQERGRGLEDYLLMGLEWKLFEERLKLIPLSGAWEIKDFSDLKNNYAFVYAPEISYKPVEDCEISVGVRLIDGKEGTNFGVSKDNDEIFFKLKYSF